MCEVFQQPFLDIEALHQVTASEQDLQAAGIKEGFTTTLQQKHTLQKPKIANRKMDGKTAQ